jgi:hypothetical protein
MDTFERWLQSRLTAHGFACGMIDGVIGPATVASLQAFQARNGLPVSGTADAATVTALRSSSSAITSEIKVQIPNRDKPDPLAADHGLWPLQRDCMSFYGQVGTNQTSIEIPFDMYLAWSKSTRIRKMTLHAKVAPSALLVFEKIAGTYSLSDRQDLGLDLFGGSLNVRRMRGGTSYSMHSWGIAIDFDPERNQLTQHRPQARLSRDDALPFWQAWEAEGWLSLGRARNFDWMHVQAARL